MHNKFIKLFNYFWEAEAHWLRATATILWMIFFFGAGWTYASNTNTNANYGQKSIKNSSSDSLITMWSKWFQGPVFNWTTKRTTKHIWFCFLKKNQLSFQLLAVQWCGKTKLRSLNLGRSFSSLETCTFSRISDHTVNNHFIDDRPSFSHRFGYYIFCWLQTQIASLKIQNEIIALTSFENKRRLFLNSSWNATHDRRLGECHLERASKCFTNVHKST